MEGGTLFGNDSLVQQSTPHTSAGLTALRHPCKSQLHRSARKVSQTEWRQSQSLPERRQTTTRSLQAQKGRRDSRWLRKGMQAQKVGRDWSRSGIQWEDHVIALNVLEELVSEVAPPVRRICESSKARDAATAGFRVCWSAYSFTR